MRLVCPDYHCKWQVYHFVEFSGELRRQTELKTYFDLIIKWNTLDLSDCRNCRVLIKKHAVFHVKMEDCFDLYACVFRTMVGKVTVSWAV